MNRLLLQVTYRCTSRCKHCLNSCSATSVGDGSVLTRNDVERFITQTRPTDYVIFTGGEASLEPELVVHGIGVAKSLGIESWLLSNGSWGRDPHFAEEFAQAMKDRGLSRASISVDVLHQEFVPVSSALGALRALRGAGVKNIRAAVTFVDRARALPIDQATEDFVELLASEPGISLDLRPQVTFAGRAIFGLEPYAPQLSLDEALNDMDKCESYSGIVGNLLPRSFYEVGPEGKVFLCAGFAFSGNLRVMEFDDIIAVNNILGHPLVSAFHTDGVRGLLDVAVLHGYTPRPYYSGICHVCWDIRDFLRPDYPDVLTPAHAYRTGATQEGKHF